MRKFKTKKIYLDNAGATPMSSKVSKVISQYQKYFFANPSSIHQLGVEARNKVDEAREKIANLISAHSDEIIFTASGTESDALAILGVVNNFRSQSDKILHIITTNIEHPAVLENCRLLEKAGLVQVTYIPVDEDGIVNPKDIRNALKENTVLVSVMSANNEIGAIQPIADVAKVIRHFRKEKLAVHGRTLGEAKVRPLIDNFPVFHTDACQAVNYLSMKNIEKLGVDLLSFNGSKIYGPKGIGVLYKKRNIKLSPLYQGGGQEFRLRSGTENVAYILGLAEAVKETFRIQEKESVRLIEIRDRTISKLMALNVTPFKIILNGGLKKRLPNNINITVSNISSELLVIELDALGLEVSEKSSCHSTDKNSSYVIKALRKNCGRKKEFTEGSLRISMGRQTTQKDMDIFVNSLNKILKKYKKWK